MIRSFFLFSSNTCDRQGQIPRMQIKSPTRQEREISNVVQISFLPSYGADFFATFLFFIQNGSRTVATVSATVSLSVQSPLCKSLEVPLSIRQSVSLSLSLSFLALWRDPQAESILGAQANKAQRNCVENNKNKKNNG